MVVPGFVEVPSWFILVPILCGLIPMILVVSLVQSVRKKRDIVEVEWQIIVLPFVAFLIPMLFFSLFMLQVGIVMMFMDMFIDIIFPVFISVMLILFLMLYWYDVSHLAPEAKPFIKVRKDLKKGKHSMVLRFVYGNDAVKYVYCKVDKKDSNMIVRTKDAGMKVNALNFPEIRTERTFDGQVSILNVSPTMLQSVSGSMVVPVKKLIEYVRGNYPDLNYLDDLNLATLISKKGTELELIAPLLLNESASNPAPMKADSLVNTVQQIQVKAAQENWEIKPGFTFFTYNEAFDVINSSYDSKLVQAFELDIKALDVMKQVKSDLVKIMFYCCVGFAIAAMGIGFGFKMAFGG